MNSKKLFERASKLFPGGVNSPVRYYAPYPRFIKKGKGSKIYDVDGNEYIDLLLAFGPMILGHANPSVVKSINERAENGTLFGAPTEEEIKLAEIIKKSSTIEMMRFVNSGSEATLHSLRLSIFFNRRKKILKVKGGYHGTHIFNYPSEIVDEVDFNSTDELENKLRSKEYSAFIVEPVMGNAGVINPADGYLENVRDLTNRYGTLLIIDEVITGYRTGFFPFYMRKKIEPDLVTLGKIVGGGLPLAVYGGKEEIMKNIKPSGALPQAGTYSGNPLSVVAGLETMKILSRKDYGKLENITKKGYEILRESGLSVNMETGMLSIYLRKGDVRKFSDVVNSKKEKFMNLFFKMLDGGIYIPPSYDETIFLSFSHSEKDVEYAFSNISQEAKRLWREP